jgi:hypothetical protein
VFPRDVLPAGPRGRRRLAAVERRPARVEVVAAAAPQVEVATARGRADRVLATPATAAGESNGTSTNASPGFPAVGTSCASTSALASTVVPGARPWAPARGAAGGRARSVGAGGYLSEKLALWTPPSASVTNSS